MWVTPVLKTDNVKSELGKNGYITADDTLLIKPTQNHILHGEILQIQRLDNSDQWLKMSWGCLMPHWNNTVGHINFVLMCKIVLLLKISMEGFHLKLVKEIARTFKNPCFIFGILFGILRSVSLHKILFNQQYVWGFHTPLEMKCVTKLIQKRKRQSTS